MACGSAMSPMKCANWLWDAVVKKMAQLMNAPTPSFPFSQQSWDGQSVRWLCRSSATSGLQVALTWPSMLQCAPAGECGLGVPPAPTLCCCWGWCFLSWGWSRQRCRRGRCGARAPQENLLILNRFSCLPREGTFPYVACFQLLFWYLFVKTNWKRPVLKVKYL